MNLQENNKNTLIYMYSTTVTTVYLAEFSEMFEIEKIDTKTRLNNMQNKLCQKCMSVQKHSYDKTLQNKLKW